MKFENIRALVKQLLDFPEGLNWSIHGFGLLRLHLPDNHRLHIWNDCFAYPGVSTIHDHAQWALESTIISGWLANTRFIVTEHGDPYQYVTLKAGYGCEQRHAPIAVRLAALKAEYYEPGATYQQKPDEIHRTQAPPGTVTIMRKTPTNTDDARVFWPAGTAWGTAEPRKATPQEIQAFVASALESWK